MNLFAVHSFVFTYICRRTYIPKGDQDQSEESKSRGGLSDLVTEMNLTISLHISTSVYIHSFLYEYCVKLKRVRVFNELISSFRSSGMVGICARLPLNC